MHKKRKISKDLEHAIEHILARDIELALNLLTAALNREKMARRINDRKGK